MAIIARVKRRLFLKRLVRLGHHYNSCVCPVIPAAHVTHPPHPPSPLPPLTVPNAMEVKFKIDNREFNATLTDVDSEAYKSMVKDLEPEVGPEAVKILLNTTSCVCNALGLIIILL